MNRMNAEVKIYDENGVLRMAENLLVTELEINTSFDYRNERSISLHGRTGCIEPKRKFNRKVLIV